MWDMVEHRWELHNLLPHCFLACSLHEAADVWWCPDGAAGVLAAEGARHGSPQLICAGIFEGERLPPASAAACWVLSFSAPNGHPSASFLWRLTKNLSCLPTCRACTSQYIQAPPQCASSPVQGWHSCNPACALCDACAYSPAPALSPPPPALSPPHQGLPVNQTLHSPPQLLQAV